MVGHRVSQAELYDDRDVIIQILKLKDTVNGYAGGIIDSIDIVGDDLVIDWADGTNISLPLPSPTGISSVTGNVSGGNLTITFYMTDGSSHAFTCPLAGMATEAYVDTGLATKADDSAVVKLTGAQSVAGVKTFTDSPIVPTTPTSPTGAVNDVYVNDATDGVNNILHKTGLEKKTSGLILVRNSSNISLYLQDGYNYPTGDNVRRYGAQLTWYSNDNKEEMSLLPAIDPNGVVILLLRIRNSDGTIKNTVLASGDVI